MMRIYDNPPQEQWAQILARPAIDSTNLLDKVSSILEEVKKNGDTALRAFTEKFDSVLLKQLEVSEEEILQAKSQISADLKIAIQQAAANIDKFHAAQTPKEFSVHTMPGVRCWQKPVAIEKVGLYIPGGTAPLFSTILMLGIPAKLAGCEDIILCTPPDKSGNIHPAILYTADLIGIQNIYKVGGAQAIAGMAFGTASIPKVFKIFGPGNQYVTAAKQLVSQSGTAIDLPAGPSEVLVFADDGAPPEFVAADLLSQAEHGTDSQVVLIVENNNLIPPIQAALKNQLVALPRQTIAEKSLVNSPIIVAKNRSQTIEMINAYAPEHLILCCATADSIASKIKNAGSIFLGYYTPESAGDYASGTNHTLPTNGFARAFSGVNMDAFYKKITYQKITAQGLKNLGPIVEKMAAAEQLVAHQQAVSVRLAALQNSQDQNTKQSTIGSIDDLVRPSILELAPYSSARSEFSGTADVWLDANEFPASLDYNRYPDPYQKKLKKAIVNIYSADTSQLFLGNGSDEAIDLLIRIFCRPGIDRIITCPPTYGMYKVSAAINDVAIETVPLLENFQLNLPAIQRYTASNDKILFICSPNNPTGNIISAKDIEQLLASFTGIVVIDQAYIDFAHDASWLARLNEFPRLVILQTFSKAWGLAGVRLGMAFANTPIINLLNKVKAPYNLSSIAQKYVLEKLQNPQVLKSNVQQIITARDQLVKDLKAIPYVKFIYPSDANFLLCKMEQPKVIYQYLIKQGIVVRDRTSQEGCEGCLRFTIGTKVENERLVQALTTAAKSINSSFKTLNTQSK